MIPIAEFISLASGASFALTRVLRYFNRKAAIRALADVMPMLVEVAPTEIAKCFRQLGLNDHGAPRKGIAPPGSSGPH